jgi:hypothetical protein
MTSRASGATGSPSGGWAASYNGGSLGAAFFRAAAAGASSQGTPMSRWYGAGMRHDLEDSPPACTFLLVHR